MQLMTWTLARLGSRFSLLFEPHHQRIRHSALGRFLDQPMDLMVGLVDPDGTERVMPFTTRGTVLDNPEQFERLNSITFRAYSARYRMRFEFNVHSVFYPQDEALCLMPVFYLEMRVSPIPGVRQIKPHGPTPKQVKLFIRFNRPETQITASVLRGRGDPATGHGGRVDLVYRNALAPCGGESGGESPENPDSNEGSSPGSTVEVRERILSLNPGCVPDPDGKGLTLDLPVTEPGSGTKWRLVWGAYCNEPVRSAPPDQNPRTGRFRYVRHWDDLDAVMDEAVSLRDDRLAHSRRLEKLVGQAPFTMAQRHLLNQGFQAFLSNTYWCDLDGGTEWFGFWGGYLRGSSRANVSYHASMFYLTLWPQLLAIQLKQWAKRETPHEPSSGGHLGNPTDATTPSQTTVFDSPVVETCQYLLLMQAYAHWTGDLSLTQQHAEQIHRLAVFLIWTDRDGTGFPTDKIEDLGHGISMTTQGPNRPTHLAVKRLGALQAASDLLNCCDQHDLARHCRQVVETDIAKIESEAWLGDHYAICIDRSPPPIFDAWDAPDSADAQVFRRDAYSIYAGSALLLPLMIAQPMLLDPGHLATELANTGRETLAAYGCGLTSNDTQDIWISQNLWRDHLAAYLGRGYTGWPQRYWDLQVMSNTAQLSLGYCDTYLGHDASFSPSGVTGIGMLLACPRLVIDRLAPGGMRISVEPDRHTPQRWPLLPLADWKAGKIPVCVVDPSGNVNIEGEADPVIIHGDPSAEAEVIG